VRTSLLVALGPAASVVRGSSRRATENLCDHHPRGQTIPLSGDAYDRPASCPPRPATIRPVTR
jgi:hypothetical protein